MTADSRKLMIQVNIRKNIYKLEKGIYSDREYEPELAIISMKYPYAVFGMDSAFYYQGLTDTIPGIYHLVTNKDATKIRDKHGKRVFVEITDHYGNIVESKIDLGVHKHLEVGQEEYCFDIAFSEERASLLINSKEQMFVEKLRSLLKFGSFSTRYKDIYDMYYQCDKLNNEKLCTCFESYKFSDPGMRENDIFNVVRRVKAVFSDRRYRQRVDSNDKRWLDDDIGAVFTKILEFLEKNAESEY